MKNPITEIKKVIKFTGGLKTKMTNAAANYKLPIKDVQKLYIESINDVIQGKKSKEPVDKQMAQFNSEDYKQIWYMFMTKCQNLVKEEGGNRKGQLTKLENQANDIAANDVKRLKIRIGKLKIKVKSLRGDERKECLDRIAKYEAFITKVESGKAVNHFVNKLKLNKDLTSFIFKAYNNWDNVVSV